MITSLFGRELPIFIGKVDSICSPNSSIHPLSRLKTLRETLAPWILKRELKNKSMTR